jgi:hypothetical protein
MPVPTKVDVDYEGLSTLQAVIKEIPSHASKFLATETFDIATEAFNDSQKQVPVRTGFLRGSGTVTVEPDETGTTITISYGGASAGYALWVHEDLAAHHKAPTKAKYLEDPVNARMAGAEDRIKAGVDGAILGQMPGGIGEPQQGGGGGSYEKEQKTLRRRIGQARGRHSSPNPMNHDDIRRALDTIDKGRELERKGRRSVRTFYRASEEGN